MMIDETNFNRRKYCKARSDNRVVQILPAFRGPNVHLMRGIFAAEVVLMDRRRRTFTRDAANEWLASLLQNCVNGGNYLESCYCL